LDHLRGFALPQQPVVDEDAGEVSSNRAVDQSRRGGGIHPAGERADGPARAHGAPDRLNLRLDE
jgi:hypothetical protein